MLAPETQVTRKNIVILSFTEPKKLHTLSNPFYLCYCNNKLPEETQRCSLATLAFQRVLFHHCKIKVQAQRSPRLPRYEFGAAKLSGEGPREAGTSLPRSRIEDMNSPRSKHHWVWSQTETKAQTCTIHTSTVSLPENLYFPWMQNTFLNCNASKQV